MGSEGEAIGTEGRCWWILCRGYSVRYLGGGARGDSGHWPWGTLCHLVYAAKTRNSSPTEPPPPYINSPITTTTYTHTMPPRSRISVEVAKPPVDFAPSIVVAETASLAGTHRIRIAANTVIHPRAKLNSALGPITIGRHCIISERTQITAPDSQGLTIGDGVVVEVNAVVEAREVGEGTAVEVGVRIGKGAVVGKVCRAAVVCGCGGG